MMLTSEIIKRATIYATYLTVILIIAAGTIPAQKPLEIATQTSGKDFPLVANGSAAPIIYDTKDHAVVGIALREFALDLERVTGKKPVINGETDKFVMIAGTLGDSVLIDMLAKQGKIAAGKIAGDRERFLIQTVENPFAGIKTALVVAGSDRRGTAFGIFELSRRIGVSPWVFWADSDPDHRDQIHLTKGSFISRAPSVKFRGIFINDEDWGLQPWAAKTYEPENGGINLKTYKKVFELLLRLKANTLWPAMHEVTAPFNSDPRNARLANEYAIVMGSSHAEPMLRNNVGEWKDAKEKFNFLTNETGVTEYWNHRARTNANFENIWTIGMRGIHDSPILGPKTKAERIATLEKIFAVQRRILETSSGEKAETIPQIFCPYKEVLDDYRDGLKVPDDVTIVFPDDNFGYIRQFPNAAEQKRKGGFGVYYHISYLGRPIAYLWLNTTPPALIFEEMSKAYVNGMRDFWMLNVGDIKPHEIGIEFFMQMAYDADRWTIENQHEFLEEFARREFGEKFAKETATVLNEYFRLNFQRRPEHLQWHFPKEPYRPSDLTAAEKTERLRAFADLRSRADALLSLMPAQKHDSFYELVVYPVRASAAANKRVFMTEIANELKAQGSPDAHAAALEAVSAATVIESETRYFNEQLRRGKWNGIMSPEMNPGQWPSFRSTVPMLEENPVALKSENAGNEDVVIIEAENFQQASQVKGFSWRVIRGLGKYGDSIAVFPQTRISFAADKEPFAEYVFEVAKDGEFDVEFSAIPTHALGDGDASGQRVAFTVDGADRRFMMFDLSGDTDRASWAKAVLDPSVIATYKGVRLSAGKHALKIYAIDSGIVLDRVVFRKSR